MYRIGVSEDDMAKVSRGKKGNPARTGPEFVAAAAALGQGAPKTDGKAGRRAARADGQGVDLGGEDPQHEARVADPQGRAAPLDRALQGYIDEVSSRRITGWVWNPQQPYSSIELELVDGDTRLARVTADHYRSDLRQVGIGDGRHAFLVPLGEELLPSARNVLHLRCAETGMEVPGSPVIIERSGVAAASRVLAEPYVPAMGIVQRVTDPLDEPAEADPVAEVLSVDRLGSADGAQPAMPRLRGAIAAEPASDAALQSNVDSANWTGIKGWVWDRQEPQKRVELELLDGDAVLVTVLANEYRADLENADIGDGRHGFSIAYNETLLPNARHVLHLRPVGSKAELPSFPLVLTRPQAGLDASVRFILGNVMAEADRAEKAEDLAPIINAMVGFLDVALSRYFYIVEEAATNVAELLDPTELSSHVRILINSIQQSYPPIVVDSGREPLVSIVIPVFNRFDLTYNCVKSIVEQGALIPFEIIIVDDCSRDETMFAAFAFGPGIRLLRNPANSGFIRSCNRGSEVARGEYVVFLNNDTEVKPRWLDELYETMQRDSKIGVAGLKLLFPDGSLQECGGIVWRLGDGWNFGRGQLADDPRFCYMRDADYVSGAALMIKAKLFAELGKFDEHFLPMYYEDTDLCFRVRQHGHRVVVQPASEIIHFEGASGGTSVTGTGMKRFQSINHRKFFERWKDTLATHRFNGELPELEAERNVRQRALFIDDSVPEPDKDAGSNAAFQHMLSLQRLGYKVTFIPGDNMARIEPYTTELQRRGIECLYHPFYFSVEDVFRKQPTPFELVYLHRYSNASKYAGMIRQHFPKARILYSVADLHFLRMQRQAELENDPSLREKADQLRRLELGTMSFVDCVIVHSSAEAELLRQIAPDIEVQVIPWTIPVRDISTIKVEHPGIAFIGGYTHPPNVDAAKWAAQSLMPVLRGKVPGIELLLVGSHMPKEVSSLAAKDIVPLGYVPSLDSVFSRIRLTIAPLRYGAGLKGKVLESLAAGIPCVMTTVAAEGIDLPAELAALVADEPEALAQRIATLCRDRAKYRRVVEAGKAHVAANYSSERIDSLIREACGAE
jgi:GT2 family glycosyltransferase/glycosyltransferase involved in cell wall biosynthesis